MFLKRKGYAWRMGEHHRVMTDALMRVYDGECKRLIINVPPRYSKTELAVVNFMGWALGNVPDAEFIHTSYSGDLAANNAWQARELVQHEEFRAIFPGMALRSDSTARNHWRTNVDGCVYAVGSGGTITGFGAGKHRPGFGGAIIIDDPHKADEARSDIKRQNVLDWFQNTLESRKNGPDTPIILIMQRLHEDDLAGWLLRGGNGEQWEHVCLPAIRDDGQPLWPAKHDLAELRRMEQASPYVFAGQYMQRPAPLEGGLFKPDQLQVVDAVPAGEIRWCRGWDLASVTEDGDWTAGGKLGRLADGRYIIGDMARLQRGPDERDAAIVNTTAMDGKSVVVSYPQDPGQAGKTQALYMTRALAGYRVKTSPETGDKVTRAEPLAAQVNVGNVLMLRGPWNEALVNEMRMFPNGSHDDQVDALSRAFAEVMAPRRSWFG
ncbi:phage terminase large subunit [Rhodanobacter hydrolyticus]|uniref:Phage terminase large subunit n=2 Tax=Rhodanobacter hydrolyticus TaxID=2250595 RepID=A0ABW8J5L8_9GAMM